MSSNFKDAHDLGALTKIIDKDFQGIPHVLVPQGADFKSLEKLLPAPKRIKSRSEFSDLESFDSYIQVFKETDSVIYLDEDERKYKTVFDHHAKDKPTWGDHSASLKLHLSNEWQRFKEADGETMNPKAFSEFIEDNIKYLSAEDMDAADILTLSQNFKITVKGDIEVNETLHAGLKKLVITDDSTVKAAGNPGKELTIPEQLNVKMRFFRNGSTYSTQVYLRYRIENSRLYFFIKIPDPEFIEEEALNEYSKEVGTKTGLKVLKGVFD